MRNLQCKILKKLNDAKVSIFVYKQFLFLCSEVMYVYRLFCTFLRMLESTGAGGLGTVKMFQALRAQSTVFFLSGGKAVVIHLSRWFFMINRT